MLAAAKIGDSKGILRATRIHFFVDKELQLMFFLKFWGNVYSDVKRNEAVGNDAVITGAGNS